MNNLPAVRKSIAGFLSLLATWGMATAPDGIQAVEWFALLGVIAGTGFVFGVRNEPGPGDPDGGQTVWRVLGVIVFVLIVLWFLNGGSR